MNELLHPSPPFYILFFVQYCVWARVSYVEGKFFEKIEKSPYIGNMSGVTGSPTKRKCV